MHNICTLILLISDVDECTLGLSNCSLSGGCLNTEGTYECYCLPGYEGDGFTCTGDNSLDTKDITIQRNYVVDNDLCTYFHVTNKHEMSSVHM